MRDKENDNIKLLILGNLFSFSEEILINYLLRRRKIINDVISLSKDIISF